MSKRLSARRRTAARPARTRGVAALVVVMVLFFVVSLVAAYTNRNLIFEQRTSANQFRATQSSEIAQAGVQWALAMLNGSRINALCQPTADNSQTSFRQRYLNIDASSGIVSHRTRSDGSILYAACIANGGSWNCDCPSDAAPSPAIPTSGGMHPAFQLRFYRDPTATSTTSTYLRPGTVRVDVVGCPSWNTTCLDVNNTDGAEGRVAISALVSLVSGLKTPPAAPLTVRTGIDVGSSALTLANTDNASGGVAVQLGGTIGGATRSAMSVTTLPGTPVANAIVENDQGMAALPITATVLPDAGTSMFASVFGITPDLYRNQPALTVLNCPCGASAIRAALAASPMKPIWAVGNVTIDDSSDIGSATEPVLLITTGDLTFSASANLYGAVYVHKGTWSSAGSGTVHGGVIAEGGMAGTGSGSYVYDPGVLTTLRMRYGSFALVPSSWKDYRPI